MCNTQNKFKCNKKLHKINVRNRKENKQKEQKCTKWRTYLTKVYHQSLNVYNMTYVHFPSNCVYFFISFQPLIWVGKGFTIQPLHISSACSYLVCDCFIITTVKNKFTYLLGNSFNRLVAKIE